MMNDRMRISDADREQAAARLREHFAEGRLTPDELDERLSAALSAKTAGDLRRLLAGLPEPAAEPAAAAPRAGQAPSWARYGRPAYRRGPRLFPLAALVLIAALVLPGPGWLLFALLKLILVFWLVASLAAVLAVARFRRRVRRHSPSAGGQWRHHYQWRD